jgi:hypothetical protein
VSYGLRGIAFKVIVDNKFIGLAEPCQAEIRSPTGQLRELKMRTQDKPSTVNRGARDIRAIEPLF